MKHLIALSLLFSVPTAAFPMSIRVDIDVNIINGDGTLNCGDENSSSEERNDSGSSREDSSDNSKNTNIDKDRD